MDHQRTRARARAQRAGFLSIAGLAVCTALAAEVRAADGPNLVLDAERMANTIKFTNDVFHDPKPGPSLDATVPISGTCVLDKSENCVGGPGIRKLLRFDVLVHNRGTTDLVLGDPAKHPELFVYSPCHHHYHFRAAAIYELLDGSGTQVVAKGRKQGFCIEDTLPSDSVNHTPKKYDCKNQGVQVGWADWYPSILDCQWIDVTDLPAGAYRLHVLWNPKHLIPETTLDDNDAVVPVTIAPDNNPPPVVENLRVGTPGEPIVANRRVGLSWAAHDDGGIVTQEVWYSTDGGATYKRIIGDLPGNQTSLVWPIPRYAASEDARIKVVARDATAQGGVLVSQPFRISLPHLRVPLREHR
jgi:hypothetical protein